MDIRSYLRSKSINFREVKRPAGPQALFPCPVCQDKAFSINLDTGVYSCYKKNKCGISGGIYKFQQLLGDTPTRLETEQSRYKVYGMPQKKLQDPDENIKKFFEGRCLDYQKAVDHFRIMKLGDSIAFRYFDYGVHIATKFRNIYEKKFGNENETKPALYNIDNCRESDTLIITEGELDCIALHQMTGINAVSVPNGTGDVRWIQDSWDDLEAFKNIILIFDTDKAGQESAMKIAQRLGIYRTSNVVLPFNDINDCLKNGVTAEQMCEIIYKAATVGVSKVVVAREYADKICDDIEHPDRLRGIQLASFKQLMKIINGVRKPESSVITGQNFAGKSTVVNQIIIELIKQKEVCAIVSLEMPPEKYLRWLLMQTLKPEETFNSEFVRKRLDEIGERLYVIEVQGSVKPEEIYEHLELACRKDGATQLFVDSLMKINLDSKDFLRAQADFVDRFIDIGTMYQAHTWLIAHPRKGSSDWDKPGKVDVSGTAHITNAADNVFTVWRCDEKTKEDLKFQYGYAPASVLSVTKCREVGKVGDVYLGFNSQNKKIFEISYQPEVMQ